MRAMKLKVSTAALLDKVKAAKAQSVADYAKAQAKYETDIKRFQVKAADALTKAAEDAEWNGKLPPRGRREYINGRYRPTLQVVVGMDRPDKPSLNVAGYDKDIALLELAADETLSIGVDDHFARYL